MADRGRVDVALLFDPPAAPQLGYRTLLQETLVLAAPAGTTPALPQRVAVNTLGRYPMVMPRAPNSLRALVDAAARAQDVTLDVVAEVDSVHTVLSLVHGGAGCTVLPRSGIAAYGDAFKLRIAAIVGPTIRNRLVLALPRTRPQTRLVRDGGTARAARVRAPRRELRAPPQRAPAELNARSR